jgi:hypothetical protein
MVALRPLRSLSHSAAFAFACLGTSFLVLGLVSKEEPGLAAASRGSRYDLDRDGLTDLQEHVIGTHPYRRDTDGDTYSDLEERARGSDPRNVADVPEAADYSVGMCASQEGDYITAICVVYAKEAMLSSVALRVGLVHRGRVLLFSPREIRNSQLFLYRGHDMGDKLAVVEFGFPLELVRRLGQVNMFSVVRSNVLGTEPVVSILPVENFSGIAMMIEQKAAGLSNGGGGATGVTYRPMAADDQIPSTWTSGQICFQATSAVGVRGAAIVHEISGADCTPMDTYCSPGDCAATVGQPLELPDPAALAGG